MSTDEALDDLEKREYGEIEFLVDESGNPLHVETVFTDKLNGRTIQTWLDEAKAGGVWQPGDRIRIPYRRGYDHVKIIRPGRPKGSI